MHSSKLLTITMLMASAVALAPPKLGKRFSTAKVNEQGGFTIPENVGQGVYSVYIDRDGIAHHNRINNVGVASTEDSHTTDEAVDNVHEKRQHYTEVVETIHCNGQDLNHAWTDEAVADLRNQCGERGVVPANHHWYAVRGNVAAFFCNEEGEKWLGGRDLICRSELIGNHLGAITDRCGWYRGGWTEQVRFGLGGTKYNIGYHHVGDDKTFCAESHF